MGLWKHFAAHLARLLHTFGCVYNLGGLFVGILMKAHSSGFIVGPMILGNPHIQILGPNAGKVLRMGNLRIPKRHINIRTLASRISGIPPTGFRARMSDSWSGRALSEDVADQRI